VACALRAATSLQQGNARITAGGCQSFCLSVRLLPAPSAVLLAGGGALSPDEGAILPACGRCLPSAPVGDNQPGPCHFVRSGESALMEEVCPAHAGWIFYISAKMVLMQKIILE